MTNDHRHSNELPVQMECVVTPTSRALRLLSFLMLFSTLVLKGFFEVSLHTHQSVPRADLLEFDHSLFDSHWKWYCWWVRQISQPIGGFSAYYNIVIHTYLLTYYAIVCTGLYAKRSGREKDVSVVLRLLVSRNFVFGRRALKSKYQKPENLETPKI